MKGLRSEDGSGRGAEFQVPSWRDESRWRREAEGRLAGKRPVEATAKGRGRVVMSFKLEGPEPLGAGGLTSGKFLPVCAGRRQN